MWAGPIVATAMAAATPTSTGGDWTEVISRRTRPLASTRRGLDVPQGVHHVADLLVREPGGRGEIQPAAPNVRGRGVGLAGEQPHAVEHGLLVHRDEEGPGLDAALGQRRPQLVPRAAERLVP